MLVGREMEIKDDLTWNPHHLVPARSAGGNNYSYLIGNWALFLHKVSIYRKKGRLFDEI